MMTISDSTVAIIGTGNVGSRLAANFAAGGQDFLLAWPSRDQTGGPEGDLTGHVEGLDRGIAGLDDVSHRASIRRRERRFRPGLEAGAAAPRS
jgi:phosphoglycerate dehydrogenase-like enzyme